MSAGGGSSSAQGASPASTRSGVADEEEDPACIIKNLDTGLEMRIDDFDRLAHIAADEPPPEPGHGAGAKKAGLMKGTKALKHWTQAQAKKAQAATKQAVKHVKEVAREAANEVQAVQHVLAQHKLSLQASPRGAAHPPHAGQEQSPLPLFGDLLRRSVGETSPGASSTLQPEDRQVSGSLASLSMRASSDLSATSQGSSKQQPRTQQQQLLMPAAAAMLRLSGDADRGRALLMQQPAPLTPRAAAAAAAAAAEPAAPAQPSVVVPALVRLSSHKSSRRSYEAAVLAQLLEGSAGVVWAVAASSSGAFLATAGQDCVLRVWQLTASSCKHTRRDWVYSSPPHDAAQQASRSPSLGGRSSDGGGGVPQQQQQQQQQQQHAGPAAAEPPAVGLSQLFDRPDAASLQQQQPTPSASGPLQSQEHQGATRLEALHVQQQQQQPLLQQQELVNQPPDVHAAAAQQQQPPPHEHQQQQQQQQQPRQHEEPGQPPVIEWGPYFSRTPVRCYLGHTEDVLCLSWSPAGSFLLSGSLDKTVRLWHLSQPGCLREFPHSDFVTSVQFHPTDAQRFVSGSIDGKIRVWSVMDAAVVATVQLHQDMVTAVSFSLSGGRVMAGTMRGRVRFYDLTPGGKLEYVAQVDVRNQRGQHASGRKVTGIAPVPGAPQQFLITTNDSRLRLLEGYGQALKYKGHRNGTTQSRAALSPDGAQVACGSDDGAVFLWQTHPGGAAGSSGSASAGGGAGGAPGAGAGAGGGKGGGGSGGGTERARAMAAAAAAQYQQLVGKNASWQSYQSLEPGQPVAAVAFVRAAAAGLPRASVLWSPAEQQADGSGWEQQQQQQQQQAVGAAASGLDGRRLVVSALVLSAGFAGGVRVHELLCRAPAGGGGGGGGAAGVR